MAFALLVDNEGDYDDPEVYGPYVSVAVAQEQARLYRAKNDIPGSNNAQPTPEENEAWSAAGWDFTIVQMKGV